MVVPQGHPLTAIADPTLEQVAQYPIVTYTEGFTGRYRIDEGFEARGLTPNYVVTAADADVIKTYVRRGLGVGIISTMAFEDQSTQIWYELGPPITSRPCYRASPSGEGLSYVALCSTSSNS